MAFKVPYRSTASEFQRASKSGLWTSVGEHIERNLSAIERELSAPRPNQRVYSYSATADRSTASATFVNWPVAEVFTTSTFTKSIAGSRLSITLLGSGFMVGAADGFSLAVRVDGAGSDHILKDGFINGLSEHQEVAGAVEISGVAVGDHTFTLRAHTSGAGTYHADANDSMRLIVAEVA